MPYALGAQRMARWRALFLDAPYAVERLPGYSADTAANPFATFAALPVDCALPLHARRGRVHDHGLHQGPGVPRPDGARRHRRPLLGRLPRALRAATTRRSRTCWRATPTCCACRPAAATPRSLIPWLQYARLENEYLKAKSDAPRAALRAAGQPRPAPDLGRRRPQRQRRAHRLPALRQRQRRQGPGRRVAEDGVGHRLSAARAHPLPAGGRLRRLRQRRAPAQLAALHGLPAHGGRVQLPRAAAAGAARRDARPVVPRRQPRHARAGLWRPGDDAAGRERHPLPDGATRSANCSAC